MTDFERFTLWLFRSNVDFKVSFRDDKEIWVIVASFHQRKIQFVFWLDGSFGDDVLGFFKLRNLKEEAFNALLFDAWASQQVGRVSDGDQRSVNALRPWRGHPNDMPEEEF